jgi:hypothetical protein
MKSWSRNGPKRVFLLSGQKSDTIGATSGPVMTAVVPAAVRTLSRRDSLELRKAPAPLLAFGASNHLVDLLVGDPRVEVYPQGQVVRHLVGELLLRHVGVLLGREKRAPVVSIEIQDAARVRRRLCVAGVVDPGRPSLGRWSVDSAGAVRKSARKPRGGPATGGHLRTGGRP